MKKCTRIVVIGAGFGGIYTINHLKSYIADGNVEVIIINKTNYFQFTPLLHEVATGGLTPTSVVEPIREIFRGVPIHCVQASVIRINTQAKQVQTDTDTYAYDFVVVSTGADTNFYAVPGAQEHSLVLKNVTEALAIRRRIIALCEQATSITDREKRKKILSFVVVGAGATGVELVVEIAEFVREILSSYHECALITEDASVVLVSNGDLLSYFSPQVRSIARKSLEKQGVTIKTHTAVTSVFEDHLMCGDVRINASLLVWTAGVKPVVVLGIPPESIHTSGRIIVTPQLHIPTDDSVFVVGDVAAQLDQVTQEPLPMLAQVATKQAVLVARNIINSIEHKPLESFTYHSAGTLISLGQWNAVGVIGRYAISGAFTWWLWRTVYLFKFTSFRKQVKIAIEWTINIFYPRDIASF